MVCFTQDLRFLLLILLRCYPAAFTFVSIINNNTVFNCFVCMCVCICARMVSILMTGITHFHSHTPTPSHPHSLQHDKKYLIVYSINKNNSKYLHNWSYVQTIEYFSAHVKCICSSCTQCVNICIVITQVLTLWAYRHHIKHTMCLFTFCDCSVYF